VDEVAPHLILDCPFLIGLCSKLARSQITQSARQHD
jgi:hypothetical protein